MAKKIYDIVPPKAKAKATTKAIDAKPKVKKTRKKAEVDLETPEVMDSVVTAEPEMTNDLPDNEEGIEMSELLAKSKKLSAPETDEAKVEPVVPKKKSFDLNMVPETEVPVKSTTAKKPLTPEIDPSIGLGKPRPKSRMMPPAPAPMSKPMNMSSFEPSHDDAPEEKKHHIWLWIFGILAIMVIGVLVYLYFSLQKVNVQIWPKTETISFQDSIGLDKSLKAVDVEKKIIPARVVEVEKSDVQEFLPTGIASSDVKASGVITVYNKISPASSFSLKIGTHFLSDSGKYFVTTEKVTIPAATTVKGKLNPGAVNVKVQAEDVGTDYNIKPAKFSVPKLSGTEYYYTIWGESADSMTGGYTGNIKKVTQSDLDQAKDTLTKKLFSQAIDSLKQGLTSDEVLLDSNVAKTVINAAADAKENAVLEKFNETAKVKVSGLVFKKQDLEAFAKQDIASHLTNNKVLLEKSLNSSYVPKTIDVSSGVASLDVTVSAKEYQDVSQTDLVNLVSGKTADQIRADLDKAYNNGGVDQVKINFWPFWVSRAPKNPSKVSVDVIFE